MPSQTPAFLRELALWLPDRKYTLLYRGSRDGMHAQAFHSLCDDKGATLVLVKCGEGWVFGGYAGASWKSPALTAPPELKSPNSLFIASAGAFLFSVTGPHTTAPMRFPLKAGKAEGALACHAGHGPCFNGGLIVRAASESPTDCYDRGSGCRIGGRFEDVLGRGWDSLNGEQSFLPVDVEVFGVSPA